MNETLVERFFAVAVEMADGRSTQLKVRGESAADAFKEVRSRPDVRRVGKVTELDERAFQADRPGTSSAPPRNNNPQANDRHQADRQKSSDEPKTPREALIGFTISGPRVVRAARPVGYEQPFRNFRAPAKAFNVPPPQESNKPVFSPFGPLKGPVANDPSRPPVFAKPEAAQAAAAAPEAAQAAAAQADAGDHESASSGIQADAATQRDYRIVKSRRQSGEPYLLQRGTWGQLKGKRVFNVEWEKGFESREKAEKQQTWLVQMALEAAALDTDEE